jgi:hypothetical protein
VGIETTTQHNPQLPSLRRWASRTRWYRNNNQSPGVLTRRKNEQFLCCTGRRKNAQAIASAKVRYNLGRWDDMVNKYPKIA